MSQLVSLVAIAWPRPAEWLTSPSPEGRWSRVEQDGGAQAIHKELPVPPSKGVALSFLLFRGWAVAVTASWRSAVLAVLAVDQDRGLGQGSSSMLLFMESHECAPQCIADPITAAGGPQQRTRESLG